jgi:hypothetical protein
MDVSNIVDTLDEYASFYFYWMFYLNSRFSNSSGLISKCLAIFLSIAFMVPILSGA